MRLHNSLAFLLLVPVAAPAQAPRAVPLDDLSAFGVSVAELDSLYAPALHADAALAVFAGREDELVGGWRALLGDLATRLREKGLEWSEPLRGYHRFYFDADGSVDRVLYHVRGLDGDRLRQYGEVLEGFAQTYRIGVSAAEPFSQCSPITLVPAGTAPVRLPAGTWTGGLTPMNHPDVVTPLTYEVAYPGEQLSIALVGPGGGVMPARDAALQGDTLRFVFDEPDAGVPLDCALERRPDGGFEGRCADAEGKWAHFSMVPPAN